MSLEKIADADKYSSDGIISDNNAATTTFLGINLGMGHLGIALVYIIFGAYTQVLRGVGFYINIAIGAALAVLLLFCKIPEPTMELLPSLVLGTAIGSLDLPGFLLISPAAVMFLLGLQYDGTARAWNTVVIGLLVGSGVTFIFFPTVWSAAGSLFFHLGAILVAEYYLAIYFETLLDNTPVMSIELRDCLGAPDPYGSGHRHLLSKYGGPVFLIAVNSIFGNGLHAQLQKHRAEIGVNRDFIVDMGVTSIATSASFAARSDWILQSATQS
ncbi:hypothetical protein BDW67DRAFT_188918 [Aspergillus spinulosporus]